MPSAAQYAVTGAGQKDLFSLTDLGQQWTLELPRNEQHEAFAATKNHQLVPTVHV